VGASVIDLQENLKLSKSAFFLRTFGHQDWRAAVLQRRVARPRNYAGLCRGVRRSVASGSAARGGRGCCSAPQWRIRTNNHSSIMREIQRRTRVAGAFSGGNIKDYAYYWVARGVASQSR
jgi:hypothetical protein